MDLDTALSDKPAEGASATEILRSDHKEVSELFGEFERARSDEHASRVIVQTLCMKLELHDVLEREVFYPAVQRLDPQRIAQFQRVHSDLSEAVERVRQLADANQPLETSMAELRKLVTAHVAEEEEQLFPRVEEHGAASLREVGLKLVKRKEELTRSTDYFEGPAT